MHCGQLRVADDEPTVPTVPVKASGSDPNVNMPVTARERLLWPSAATALGHGDRTAATPRDAESVRPVQDLTDDEAPDGRDRATTRIQPTTIASVDQSRRLARTYLQLIKEGRSAGAAAHTSSRWRHAACGVFLWITRGGLAPPNVASRTSGDGIELNLDETPSAETQRAATLCALDDALETFAQMDPRRAQVVELRYFGRPQCAGLRKSSMCRRRLSCAIGNSPDLADSRAELNVTVDTPARHRYRWLLVPDRHAEAGCDGCGRIGTLGLDG